MSLPCFIFLLFTGRNEVVAKVIFLHLSVILFTGGGRGSAQCMLGYHHPPEQTPPGPNPPRSRHPPEQTPLLPDPPRTRPPGADTTPLGLDPSPPGPDPPRADPPEQTHPRADTPRTRLQHTVYERAGTHPTGMHSCLKFKQ